MLQFISAVYFTLNKSWLKSKHEHDSYAQNKSSSKKTSDFIFKGSKVSADADSPLQKKSIIKIGFIHEGDRHFFRICCNMFALIRDNIAWSFRECADKSPFGAYYA
jgi:hypothetical protein